MQLYHFRNDRYGLKSLREKRLRISRINELNDPFELLGCNLSDRDKRKAFQVMKDKLNKDKGLLCFSASWRSPVQWAHYTDNHKGICMGFEVQDEFLMKVKYVNSRLNCSNTINTEYMQIILSTKFSHWSYEKEHRVFLGLNHSEVEHDHYFEPFSDKLKLNEVIVGCNSELKRTDIMTALGKDGFDIEVFKARPAFGSFRIVRNQNEKLWT